MGRNYSGITDVGLKRETNQDAFSIEEFSENKYLFTVCDGMGGAKGGSTASSLCAETFVSYVRQNIDGVSESKYISLLEDALCAANTAVCEKAASSKEFEGMGTTLVAALYDGNKYYLVWVGDSRIYGLTDSGMIQLSHDHSFVQSLVDSGSITEEEAKTHPNRNIITKAVGIEKNISCDVCEIDSEALTGILLCSDGLCGYVEESEITSVIKNEKDAGLCCEKLVSLANDAGGADNITVIIHNKQ